MLNVIQRNRPSVWKGLVAGLAGGIAATVAMTQFQNGWQKASKALQAEKNGGSGKSNSQAQNKSRKQSQNQSQSQSQSQSKNGQENEDATMKAAGKVASLAGYHLSFEEKKKVSPVVHYGFGASMGALYGVLHEMAPKSFRSLNPVLAGVGYGSALFVGADEIAVPTLGLSESPKKTPVSAHVYGLASHAVYGLTGEMVRRTVRKYL
jgi:putative membrane protein